MQQVLKPPSGAARTLIVAAKLFSQFDTAMDDALATLDMGFRGKGLRRLCGMLKSWGGFRDRDACALLRWLKPGPLPRMDARQTGHFILAAATASSASISSLVTSCTDVVGRSRHFSILTPNDRLALKNSGS